MAVDPSLCAPVDIQKCLEQHQTMDAGIIGKLATLNLAQKQKLSVLMDQWITKITT